DTVVNLKDPVGEVIDSWVREDGLRISRVRVPIGAIGIIYESRPNVTLDATVLALKSGNSVLLRGGSDAFNSNMEIVRAIKDGLKDSDIPENSVEYVEDTSHEIVGEMLKLNGILDLIIPRGGSSLIKFVVENSTVPVLETGVGNCHIFVDESANLEKALDIIDNAKTQRPGTCNAVETVLIHEKIAEKILPPLVERLKKKGVEMRGCEKTREYVDVHPATEKDWETEYLDLILAVKVVKDVDEAINHIKRYSTGHSEAILTENYTNARKFISSIDSSAVYVNASTRLTDGGEFGFGGEMGISTQKLHARGPVGLRELTTYKFVILGDYHTRK
ncbi:MAG TPA: glutamate-5-semialdehyde dehydrogenase, partial [Thermotogales bacterium]|nr:glutamate-5-semialdehyde dehydrogenase [Thermotogales bacterium]